MKSLLLGWLLLVGSLSLAQTTRTDLIYKIDGSTIKGKVDKLTDAGIIYTGTTLPKSQKMIPRRQVSKIAFGDGRMVIITPKAVSGMATDKITLTDQTVVTGKVIRRDDLKLYYTKSNDPTNTQQELSLSQLDRIQYADGREDTISKPSAVSTPATPVVSPAQSAETTAPDNARPKLVASESYSAPATSASTKNTGAFARVHVTIGPEISLFSQSGVARWSNQYSGLGMNQSIGASLRFDYRLIQAVAVSFTGGYYQWELVRNYLQNNTEKYDETIQLTRIPIQVGAKLCPYKGFYLLPEAGVNLLMSSAKTSGAHPAPTNEQSSTTPITYGASLGYEFNLGGLLLDLSGRYQILNVKNLNFGAIAPSLTEQVQFGSLRLGIGFNALKK